MIYKNKIKVFLQLIRIDNYVKIFFMKGKNLNKWKLSLLNYDKKINIAFVKFEPKL